MTNLDVNKVAKKYYTMTVNLQGMREFKVRLWIVLQLLKLIAFIAPCKVETEE